MDGEASSFCLKIMDQLMRKPICRPFLTTSHPGIYIQAKIDPKIETLEEIRSKLSSREFKSPSQWFDSVENFLSQVGSCQKSSHLLQTCILDLQAWVKKRRQKSENILRQSQSKYLSDSFNTLTGLASESDLTIGRAEGPLVRPDQRPAFKPFSAVELEILAEAISSISKVEAIEGIIAIAESLEHSVTNSSGESAFDINNFSSQTLHTMRLYVKDEMRKLGLKYPE